MSEKSGGGPVPLSPDPPRPKGRRRAQLKLAPAEPAPPPAAEEPQMDIHKPKPVHNLREFLGEILIIVIGVLIALGLEQAVEAWHWRHQVENAESALGSELSETVGQGNERITVSDCVDRRLDQLADIVDRAAESGRLPPVGDIAMPPSRTWSTGVWQSTLAGQTGEHLGNDERIAFSVTYGFVALLGSTNARELEIWTRLYALVGPGRALQPGEASELRRAISEARTANQIMGLSSVRVEQAIQVRGVKLDSGFVHSFDQPKADYAICRPLGAVPARYGSAPIADAIDRARAAPIRNGSAGRPIAGATPR